MHLTDDNLDDAPVTDQATGFRGVDMATDPGQLPPEMLQAAVNVLLRGDGVLRSRPKLAFNANLGSAASGVGDYAIRGAGYYDLPDFEGTLVLVDNRLILISSAADNATATLLASISPAGTGLTQFVQMADRMFYLAGGIIWWSHRASNGTWTHNSLAAFSDGTAMPTWGRIATQGFRLLAMEANGYKLYTSAVGQAHQNTDWVKTDNVRVGSGEGDPARSVVSGQGAYVSMLNARSVYQLDISAAAVANWTSLRVSGQVGCVAGKTAVTMGADVYFLSRHGVINLGALADTISISPSTMLSAPIQPLIDRINWSAITAAWAVAYREFYVLAVPLDAETKPKTLIAFNTITRQWSGTWTLSANWQAQGNTSPGPGTLAFGGFMAGLVVNYGDKAETLIADDAARVFRLDETKTTDACLASSGVNMGASATLREFSHGQPDCPKQPVQLELTFMANAGQYTGTVVWNTELTRGSSGGGTLATVVGATITGAARERQRILMRGQARFRTGALTITTTDTPLLLTGATMSAFVDPAGYT